MDAIASAAVAFFVTSLLLSHLTGTATALAPPPSPPSSCSTAIVLFSPCLPYVSSPPNDLDSSVTPWCCRAFSSVLGSGSGVCLCYLLREPDMLGFPLNNSRLVSLSSDCSLLNASFVNRGSLESLCSASPPLPLLGSSNGSSNTKPEPDASPPSIPSPETSSPLDSAAGSETAPSYAPEPADFSPGPSEDPTYSSAMERFTTTKRSRLLVSLVNALVAIIVGHL